MNNLFMLELKKFESSDTDKIVVVDGTRIVFVCKNQMSPQPPLVSERSKCH